MALASGGTEAATVTVEAPERPQTSNPQGSLTSAGRVTLQLVPRRKKAKKKGVQWTDDTVDNEGLGRKSSKKCCIFHRRRAFGDWSDDEDSDQECDCPDPTGDAGKDGNAGASGESSQGQ